MVRLVDIFLVNLESLRMFQFQYGAIGRLSELVKAATVMKFQFQYGAIGRINAVVAPFSFNVSIPVWCDW